MWQRFVLSGLRRRGAFLGRVRRREFDEAILVGFIKGKLVATRFKKKEQGETDEDAAESD
jgi:hypothetical protein